MSGRNFLSDVGYVVAVGVSAAAVLTTILTGAIALVLAVAWP
jgi:hypothetical protein